MLGILILGAFFLWFCLLPICVFDKASESAQVVHAGGESSMMGRPTPQEQLCKDQSKKVLVRFFNFESS